MVHADLSELSTKPWNDIVVDGRGNIYVNNIGFDFEAVSSPRAGRPGHTRRFRAAGRRRARLPQRDGRVAGQSDAGGSRVVRGQAHRIRDPGDGSLAGGQTWAELGENAAPDGICLDAENAAWYASVPGRHCVRVAKGGEVLQTVEADRGCFACMLGGPDGRTLFVVGAVAGRDGGEGATGQVLPPR